MLPVKICLKKTGPEHDRAVSALCAVIDTRRIVQVQEPIVKRIFYRFLKTFFQSCCIFSGKHISGIFYVPRARRPPGPGQVPFFFKQMFTGSILRGRASPQDSFICGCVYHRGNQAGTLVLSRRWSIFEHCGWCIIYVKLNSRAVYKKQNWFSSKIRKDRRLQSWPLRHSKKY